MGWYVTCEHCKLEEKYKHPDCDCRYNQYIILMAKVGDARILETFEYVDYALELICIHYNNDVFIVCNTVIGKHNYNEPILYPTEITQRGYNLHKLYKMYYTDYDLDKLFLFNHIFTHHDVFFHVLLPIYNDVEEL